MTAFQHHMGQKRLERINTYAKNRIKTQKRFLDNSKLTNWIQKVNVQKGKNQSQQQF